jgi:hypothetical protein
MEDKNNKATSSSKSINFGVISDIIIIVSTSYAMSFAKSIFKGVTVYSYLNRIQSWKFKKFMFQNANRLGTKLHPDKPVYIVN